MRLGVWALGPKYIDCANPANPGPIATLPHYVVNILGMSGIIFSKNLTIDFILFFVNFFGSRFLNQKC